MEIPRQRIPEPTEPGQIPICGLIVAIAPPAIVPPVTVLPVTVHLAMIIHPTPTTGPAQATMRAEICSPGVVKMDEERMDEERMDAAKMAVALTTTVPEIGTMPMTAWVVAKTETGPETVALLNSETIPAIPSRRVRKMLNVS
ncbi:MAG: hypothetical protein C0478_08920 [Planctomyces sp.]|nr:hypothetical protein [Planctomyces sp.]